MIWLISTYDYCAPKWAAGHDCSGPPMSVGAWIVAILAWAVGFAILLKLLHYGIVGILRPLLARPHYKSEEYDREFSRVRRYVLLRDGHRCTVCGSTEHLDVHHRIPRSQGGTNDPSNLITLCRLHHGVVHGKNWR